MKVRGVMTGGVPGEMIVVLLSAARLINDYTGCRKSPNCEWGLDVTQGPNKGSVFLQCRTRNGCGIAAGSELLTAYGTGYDLGCPQANSDRVFSGPAVA